MQGAVEEVRTIPVLLWVGKVVAAKAPVAPIIKQLQDLLTQVEEVEEAVEVDIHQLTEDLA
jgi:predicted DNA-binding transcriptional regulator